MKVGAARSAAVDWISTHVIDQDWFGGAYFAGSTVGLPDERELPVGSDVDVMLVTCEGTQRTRPGKVVHRDALLDLGIMEWRRIAVPEAVLSSYHVAGGFRLDSVIFDPTGHLRSLHAAVAPRFSEPVWVRRRCDDAVRLIETRLRGIDAVSSWPDQVTTWLFGTGVMTHVLLVAALRNPTVRTRYVAARELLAERRRLDLHARLLELLGCADLVAERARHHLLALGRTFDVAASVAKTPFFFSSDITLAARPIAIDGSHELIEHGFHREVVFWIVATFARCQKILATDAEDRAHALAPAFADMLADLGIASTADLQDRADAALRFLPALRAEAEDILTSAARSDRCG